MDTTRVKARARQLARVPTSGLSDAEANTLLNECIRQMAADVHGFHKEGYVQVAAKFDLRTYWAIRLTITGGTNALAATDIAICATDADNQTGAQAAAALQVAIRAAGAASATVTWTAFYFTIGSVDGTSIEVASPSDDETYADATSLLFGTTGEQTGTDWTGGFPSGATIEADLPSDYLDSSLRRVDWDDRELRVLPEADTMSYRGGGDPAGYAVLAGKLRLIPSPKTQGICKIWYRSAPTDIATAAFETSLPSAIPADLHVGLAYLLASEMARSLHDEAIADQRYARYWRERTAYKVRINGASTKLRNPFETEDPFGAIFEVAEENS